MDYTIKYNRPAKEGMLIINEIPHLLILFVLGENDALIGTVTDGDLRRGLIQGLSTDSPIKEFMNEDFTYLEEGNIDRQIIHEAKEKKIRALPLLDKNRKLIHVFNLEEVQTVLPLDILIQAGGEGKRLRPLTETTPKPLLKVGEHTILDHLVGHLKRFGLNTFNLSINYLAEKFHEKFSTSNEINLILEEKKLGTAGSLKLVPDWKNDTILMLNSDILTNFDLEKMYERFLETDSDICVATLGYPVDIPFGVLETQGESVKGIKEKPQYLYQVNGGIYLLKRELIDLIPDDHFFDATDLAELAIKEKKKVSYYQIVNYWLDIGRHSDFEKAQNDITQVFHK